jgi:Rieske Fe-S protein
MSQPTGFPKIVLFFLISILLIFQGGCDKQEEYIPYVSVNFYITINPELATVGVMGYYIQEGEGVNGILILRRDVEVYEAYDLTCTYLPFEQKCRINMDNTGYFPVCPCCQSEFNLLNYGYPAKGPAKRPLKQYRVHRSGNFLQITN